MFCFAAAIKDCFTRQLYVTPAQVDANPILLSNSEAALQLGLLCQVLIWHLCGCAHCVLSCKPCLWGTYMQGTMRIHA